MTQDRRPSRGRRAPRSRRPRRPRLQALRGTSLMRLRIGFLLVSMVVSVFAVVLLTFFFMVYGQNLQRHAIALLPTRQRKKLTVEILQAIEIRPRHEVIEHVDHHRTAIPIRALSSMHGEPAGHADRLAGDVSGVI